MHDFSVLQTMTKPENIPPVLNEEILVSELSANVGELVRWQLPDGLFTDPVSKTLGTTLLRSSEFNPIGGVMKSSYSVPHGSDIIGVSINV